MSDFYAITICRQYCSGGNMIAEKLAEKLNIKMYDKQLITLAAEESGFSESVFEKADETASSSLLYSVVMGSSPMSSLLFPNNSIVTNDSLFSLQSKIIKDIAARENCIVIGRCSDYVLREHPRLIRVYLWAEQDFRIERYKQLHKDSTEKDIANALLKADKKRKSYYSYYSGNEWDCAANYDLVINVSKTGVDGAVKQILDFKDTIGY